MLPCPKGKGQKSRKPCPHLPIVEMQAGPSVYGLPRCLYYRVRRLNDCEDSPPPRRKKKLGSAHGNSLCTDFSEHRSVVVDVPFCCFFIVVEVRWLNTRLEYLRFLAFIADKVNSFSR